VDKLRSLKSSIDDLISGWQTICLWFSGGNDSRLLLEVMLETKKPFGILRFDDGWNREQRKQVDAIILKHNLQVFSYPPIENLLVGNDTELSLASRYAVNGFGQATTIIRDLVDDPKRCAFDLMLETPKQLSAPTEFAAHIRGTRKEDRHWIGGNEPLLKGEDWYVGEKYFVAPLWDWTAEDVAEALKIYEIDAGGNDLGDIYACTNCLRSEGQVFCPKEDKEIDGVKWDRKANLARLGL
jgi:3'-phosphoadenosine 5'-phosphosulfate sulfotransferase (PAPS reductase)/FAD synthetase